VDPDPHSIVFLATTLDVLLLLKLTFMGVLLFFSAMISGAEVAFFSLSPSDLTTLSKSKNKRHQLVFTLRKNPKKLLAAILVGNNFINIATVLLFASMSNVLFSGINSTVLRFVVEVGLITFLILLFGEILPKVYANRNAISFAKRMAIPINFMDCYIFFFLTVPMSKLTNFLHNSLGKTRSNISVDQLSKALELTDEKDTTDEEQQILQGIVSFGNIDTKQVMRPRIDMFALSESLSFEEVTKQIVAHGFSRIPVYKEQIDTVIGVLYIKDLLPYLNQSTYDWTQLLLDPYFVPENKKLDDLLMDFQSMKMHLAIVVDEYGGTSGLVTLEDIMEEIVGEISDEFDDNDVMYSKIDKNTVVFEGKTNLKDVYRIMQFDDESSFEEQKGEAETLAGFVLEQTGVFPRKNTFIEFNGAVFTVEAVDKKRIQRVKVHKKQLS
jgi:gliding motility-associated protein GldE